MTTPTMTDEGVVPPLARAALVAGLIYLFLVGVSSLDDGALQGYFVDAATAEAHGIASLGTPRRTPTPKPTQPHGSPTTGPWSTSG